MILFVEDDAIAQFIYQEWFPPSEKIMYAESISEAKYLLTKHTFTCAVCDVHLPDGLIFEIGVLLQEKGVTVALAFGSHLPAEEKKMLEDFVYDVRFSKPLNQADLEAWITKQGE